MITEQEAITQLRRVEWLPGVQRLSDDLKLSYATEVVAALRESARDVEHAAVVIHDCLRNHKHMVTPADIYAAANCDPGALAEWRPDGAE